MVGCIRLLYGLVSLYSVVALVRASNAVFIVSLVFTFPYLSPTFHGLILASYALAEGLTGFLVGGFYERFGGRLTLVLATLALSISYTAMTLSGSPTATLVLNSLNGVMAAGVLVASLSALAEETRGRPLARLLGSGGFEASNLGGYALGFIVAFVLELLGLLEGFMAPAILSLLALLLALPAPSGGERGIVFHVERRALKLAPLWFGLASLIGLAFMAPKILDETGIAVVGLDRVGGGLSLTLIAGLVAVALGLLVGSYIASLIGKLRAVTVGVVSTALLLVVGGLYYDMLLKPHLLPLLALPAIPPMMLPPAMLALLADYTDTSKTRGVQMGFYVTVLALGIAFGEFILGGLIFDKLGLTATAIAAAVTFLVLATPTLYLVYGDHRLHQV
jgi:predicted MFS family arabinose efflux permease